MILNGKDLLTMDDKNVFINLLKVYVIIQYIIEKIYCSKCRIFNLKILKFHIFGVKHYFFSTTSSKCSNYNGEIFK